MGRNAILAGVASLAAGVVSCASPSVPSVDVRAPVVFDSRIGDIGGIGCPEEGDPGPCDVAFKLTAIEQSVRCEDDDLADMGPNQQLVRFTITVSTQQVFRYSAQQYDDALFLENWLIGGPPEAWYPLIDHHSAQCRGDDISVRLVPGSLFTKSVLVTAPQPARTLLLTVDGDGWKWPIPPALQS